MQNLYYNFGKSPGAPSPLVPPGDTDLDENTVPGQEGPKKYKIKKEDPTKNGGNGVNDKPLISNPWKYVMIVAAVIFGAFIAKMTKKR